MLFSALLLSACGPGADAGKPSDTSGTDCDAPGFVDADGDGYGDASATCAEPGVAEDGDCDDADPEVHPGAAERCNDRDDNCDGEPDGPVGTWYTDADGDGHGDPATATDTCMPDSTQVEAGDDCDDLSEWVYAGAAELCDGVDNDCDGVADGVGLVSWLSDDGTWEDRTEETSPHPDLGYSSLTLGLDGDLWICPGTYAIRLHVYSNRVVAIHGRGGAAATVLELPGVSYAILVDESSTTTIEGLTLTGSAPTGWGGGALHIQEDASVVASNLVFTGNSSEGVGGAIFVGAGASLDGTGILVEDNASHSNGGVVTARDSDSLRISNATFRRNSGSAGALSATATSVTVEDCVFEDNIGSSTGAISVSSASRATITRSTFSRNTGGGGALSLNASINTVTDSTFTDNTATLVGGGISATGNLTLSGVNFHGNTAPTGAGLYFNLGVGTISDSTFTDGVATGQGGAIYVASSGLELSNTTITSNQAGEGGAIYVSSSEVTGTGLDIEGNTAVTGGAIASIGESVSLVGGSVSGNTATADGGAFYQTGSRSEMALDGVLVEGNVALARGGAIALTGGALTASGATFYTNVAATGGAACVEDGELYLDGASVTGNSADLGGGVALLLSGHLSLGSGTTISNNVALEAGGGLYLYGYGSTGSSATQESICDSSSATTNSPHDAWFDFGDRGRFEATSCPLGVITTPGGDFDASATPDFVCDDEGCR